MKRTSWKAAALAVLALGLTATGVGEAKGQWAEVSTVRYGLLGRPRSIETQLVPTVRAMPTTTIVSSGTIIGEPVIATRYVPSGTVVSSRYLTVDPDVFPTGGVIYRSDPVIRTEVISPAPVVRSYVPTTVRVLEPSVYYLP